MRILQNIPKIVRTLMIILSLQNVNSNLINSEIKKEKYKKIDKIEFVSTLKEDMGEKLFEKYVQKPRLENLINNIRFHQTKQNIENKKIPIFMFHKINWSGKRYSITPTAFKRTLDMLCENNYVLINLKQLKTGNFSNIPVGKKLAMYTFDDAWSSQFSYLKNSKIINPKSAIGIMEKYKQMHPNFINGGVFFECYFGVDKEFLYPFGDVNTAKSKNDYLIAHGYSLGEHTVRHSDFRNATLKDVKEDVITMDALLQNDTKTNYNKQIRAFAYPYGSIARRKAAKEYLEDAYSIIMNATGGSENHPLSSKFNPHAIYRIEASQNIIKRYIHKKDQYKITYQDSIFYNAVFNYNPKTSIDVAPIILKKQANEKINHMTKFKFENIMYLMNKN